MGKDELAALADCIGILLDDIRKNKTPINVELSQGSTLTGAGDNEQQKNAPIVGPQYSTATT